MITLVTGKAAARLAEDFQQLGEARAWIQPLAVVLQLPVVACWLLLRPISVVAFAGCSALAGRMIR